MNSPDNEATGTLKAFVADTAAAGRRVDQWLAEMLGSEMSRARVQALLKQGQVSINGRIVREAKQKLGDGNVVELLVPEPEDAEPLAEDIALEILYEDDALIVINKPVGLVVHPGAGIRSGTLVNALLHHCGDTLSGIGGVRRPGIVHRLDKDTSGVMVVAKTDQAHRALSEAFADHGRSGDLERAYVALVWGRPSHAAGMVNAPLGRSTRDRTSRAVVPEGRSDARHAVTHYTVLERFGEHADGSCEASLVECRLETGRTHQIRVHMAHIGHPLIGDRTYGQSFFTKARKLPDDIGALVSAFPRQALHARLLAFRHPVTDEIMRFEADMPGDLENLAAALRTL